MTAMLDEAGIRNYTIWTDGVSLFGYYECDSVERAARVQRESEVNARWSRLMQEYLIAEPDPVTGAQPQLRRVFLHP
jgi:L-rhamnose mutarotase